MTQGPSVWADDQGATDVANALTQPAGSSFGGAATRQRNPLVMSIYTNVWILAALATGALVTGRVALPATMTGVIGLAGVCATYVTAYVCWYVALSIVAPIRLATLLNIEPLVTLIAAWVVLGERLAAMQLLGAALVLASVASVTLARRSTPEGTRPQEAPAVPSGRQRR